MNPALGLSDRNYTAKDITSQSKKENREMKRKQN